MKRILFSIISFLLAMLLASCGIGSFSSITPEAYMGEEVLRTLTSEDEEWAELSDMIRMLTVNSADVPEFDKMSRSVELCRDSLLNYMLGRHFSKYSGNPAMIEEVAEKYPSLDVTCAIPQSDFEAEMYRCFGGNVKITHRSTELFTYLEDAEAYVPVTSPIYDGVDMTLESAEETESAFRLTFTASAGEHSAQYFAVLVKREDGTKYFDAVLKK